jgi:hypothetical protein
LPVLSASSCSIQSANAAISSPSTSVTLSRPASASSPRNAPSETPGLRAAGTFAPDSRSSVWAASSSAPMSAPISAAGTRPKQERALKRPPIVGGFRNVRR